MSKRQVLVTVRMFLDEIAFEMAAGRSVDMESYFLGISTEPSGKFRTITVLKRRGWLMNMLRRLYPRDALSRYTTLSFRRELYSRKIRGMSKVHNFCGKEVERMREKLAEMTAEEEAAAQEAAAQEAAAHDHDDHRHDDDDAGTTG